MRGQVLAEAETYEWRGHALPVKRTSAPRRIIRGVEFSCWRVGANSYEWRGLDSRIRVTSNFRLSGYYTAVDGVRVNKMFRKLETAMLAGVEAAKA